MILVIYNVRSAHNVGSIIRTANGLGLSRIICTGYTPYPKLSADSRLPHESEKAARQISKTSLGAERDLDINHVPDIERVINDLRKKEIQIVALEQGHSATPLSEAKISNEFALIVGNEVKGIDGQVLKMCDFIIEIPMKGTKESFNVAVAAAIAAYELTSRKSI